MNPGNLNSKRRDKNFIQLQIIFRQHDRLEINRLQEIYHLHLTGVISRVLHLDDPYVGWPRDQLDHLLELNPRKNL